ncbi:MULTISPECIES: acyl-CoA dehydrogenase family protein [unclassified Mycobacterium]|uniref:acyl-CoA dehydrogenase family protein n=1 Tax=unclassified Mycobacterium TaxID=2642494 RepID=UPI0029C94490|nr:MULTISPECIES: acyl-CoA dehydrogenase family protein [unclassified Mycobacterium]
MTEIDDLPSRLNDFFAAHSVPESTASEDVAAARAFQHALFDAGLAGLSWPTELGGQGLPNESEQIFTSVAQGFRVPIAPLTLTLKVCGPAVVEFGTPEQHHRHVSATLRGEQVWCQLWSEPEAGSDLAGVRTRAIRESDGGWLIEGQKIWTSGGHYADYALLLCRTDPDAPKHKGLSMMIVDMRHPGITIRPLRQMTGDAEFNEVFLDQLRVPADAVLGEPGQGWRITTWMMGRERISVGTEMRNSRTLAWSDVHAMAVSAGRAEDPLVRARLALLHIHQQGAHLLSLRLAQEIRAGAGNALLGSAIKVAEAAVIREGAELAIQILGADAAAWDPDDASQSRAAEAVLMSPAFAIGGGTDEIQLNTLGEHVLGLPR